MTLGCKMKQRAGRVICKEAPHELLIANVSPGEAIPLMIPYGLEICGISCVCKLVKIDHAGVLRKEPASNEI